jgi:hypothetical protein
VQLGVLFALIGEDEHIGLVLVAVDSEASRRVAHPQ